MSAVRADISSCKLTKAVVCVILSVGSLNKTFPFCLWDDHIKEPLLLIGKSSHVAAAGFLSRYLNGPLPYVRRHITVNVLSASLIKAFPSFLPENASPVDDNK